MTFFAMAGLAVTLMLIGTDLFDKAALSQSTSVGVLAVVLVVMILVVINLAARYL